MYQCQVAAYQRDVIKKPRLPSTPSTPPHHRTLEDAAEAKRQVLSQLPEKCSHCSAPLQQKYFTECKESIFVYCKAEGGCGKSQVLFVAPDSTSRPIYAKVCIFSPSPEDEDWTPPVVEPPVNDGKPVRAALYVPPEIPSKYNPEAICTLCSVKYSDHKNDPDENGWAIVGHEEMSFPSDYPRLLEDGNWSHV